MGRRIYAYDVLKIIGAICVITIHVSAKFMGSRELCGADWCVALAFDVASRWSVPIFIMVNGALVIKPAKVDENESFLGLNLSEGPRKIGPLLITYIVWSTFYAFVSITTEDSTSLRDILSRIISGEYHLWYLPMMMGIYALLPILDYVACSPNATRILVLVTLGIETLRSTSSMPLPLMAAVKKLVDNSSLSAGYVGYFMLGYLLRKKIEAKRETKASFQTIMFPWVAIVCLFLLEYVSTYAISKHEGKLVTSLMDYCSPFVVLISVLLFYHIGSLYRLKCSTALAKNLSDNGLGLYLFHLFIMNNLLQYFIDMPAIIGIPILVLAVWILSQIVIQLAKRCPWIRHIV